MISERCDLFFIFFKIHSISNKEVSIEKALNMLEEWLFSGLFVKPGLSFSNVLNSI